MTELNCDTCPPNTRTKLLIAVVCVMISAQVAFGSLMWSAVSDWNTKVTDGLSEVTHLLRQFKDEYYRSESAKTDIMADLRARMRNVEHRLSVYDDRATQNMHGNQ